MRPLILIVAPQPCCDQLTQPSMTFGVDDFRHWDADGSGLPQQTALTPSLANYENAYWPRQATNSARSGVFKCGSCWR